MVSEAAAKQVCPPFSTISPSLLLFRFENPLSNRYKAYGFVFGAEDGTRTHDLLVTNELLYQLSYFGIALS